MLKRDTSNGDKIFVVSEEFYLRPFFSFVSSFMFAIEVSFSDGKMYVYSTNFDFNDDDENSLPYVKRECDLRLLNNFILEHDCLYINDFEFDEVIFRVRKDALKKIKNGVNQFARFERIFLVDFIFYRSYKKFSESKSIPTLFAFGFSRSVKGTCVIHQYTTNPDYFQNKGKDTLPYIEKLLFDGFDLDVDFLNEFVSIKKDLLFIDEKEFTEFLTKLQNIK